MTLRSIRKFRVQSDSVRKTLDAIRAAGREGYELFVVWSGTSNGDAFDVAEVHVPRQTAYRLENGLCVRVDGSELHRLNTWLYEAHQVVGVQVHSHPTDAYHSETDDTYPVATLEGSLSIVFPFFGRDGWESDGIAAYRLIRGNWLEIPRPLRDLVEVVENGTS
jgi:hypothetical protein